MVCWIVFLTILSWPAQGFIIATKRHKPPQLAQGVGQWPSKMTNFAASTATNLGMVSPTNNNGLGLPSDPSLDSLFSTGASLPLSHGHSGSIADTTTTTLLANFPDLSVVAIAVLALAIGAFVYANVVITPEIIEENEQMRLQSREVEVRKLIALVQQQQQRLNDLEELRFPLEEAFGMTIEEYIVDVQNPNALTPYASADRDLAELLRPMVRKEGER